MINKASQHLYVLLLPPSKLCGFYLVLKVSPHEKVKVSMELTICPGGITAVAWIRSNVVTIFFRAQTHLKIKIVLAVILRTV